jgi:hypothetical protein
MLQVIVHNNFVVGLAAKIERFELAGLWCACRTRARARAHARTHARTNRH